MKHYYDELYNTFQNFLDSLDPNDLNEMPSEDQFIEQVTQDFLDSQKGFVQQHEEVKDMIEEEVWEMLRKTTYGFFNLYDFLEKKAK